MNQTRPVTTATMPNNDPPSAEFRRLEKVTKSFRDMWELQHAEANDFLDAANANPLPELLEEARTATSAASATFNSLTTAIHETIQVLGENHPDSLAYLNDMLSKANRAKRDMTRHLTKAILSVSSAENDRKRQATEAAQKIADTEAKTATANAAAAASAASNPNPMGAHAAPTAQQAPGATAIPTPKITGINDLLMPTKLSTDSKPMAYTDWKGDVEEYFQANNLKQLPFSTQVTCILNCMEESYKLKLRSKFDKRADPFGPNGLLAVLEKDYNQSYPLLQKRLDAATIKLKPGESIFELVARFNNLKMEADWANLTPDVVATYTILNAIPGHQAFKDKIFENPNISYSEFEEKVNALQAAKSLTAATTDKKEAASVNAITQKGKGKGKKPQQGGATTTQGQGQQKQIPPPPATITINPTTMRGRCYTCGANNHTRSACTKTATAKCSTCGKNSHFSNTCMAAYNEWCYANGHKARPVARSNVNEITGDDGEPQSDESPSD